MLVNKQARRLSFLMHISTSLFDMDMNYFQFFIIGVLSCAGDWKSSIDVIEQELFERYEKWSKTKHE